jgi:hypothetical protein
VLAPTRELTAQIKAEAVKLLKPHGNSLGVQVGACILVVCFGFGATVCVLGRVWGVWGRRLQGWGPHGNSLGLQVGDWGTKGRFSLAKSEVQQRTFSHACSPFMSACVCVLTREVQSDNARQSAVSNRTGSLTSHECVVGGCGGGICDAAA